MKSSNSKAAAVVARPSAAIRRAHNLGIPIAALARELDLDAQSLYRNARVSSDTLRRIKKHLDALERGAALTARRALIAYADAVIPWLRDASRCDAERDRNRAGR